MNRVSIEVSLSGSGINWQQPVEILETPGVGDGEWRLRAPESDTTATGASYRDARENLSTQCRVIKKGKREVDRVLRERVRSVGRGRTGI